jgi:hypothetical protein
VKPDDFEPMWTIQAWKYVLCDGLPLDVNGGEPMAVLIEDDELAETVVAWMKEAGVPTVDDLESFPKRAGDRP